MRPVRVSAERAYDRLRRRAAQCRGGRSAERRLPTFLILGTQRAGTTSLYSYLARHTQIRSAVVKEVHYFDHNYHRDLRWYAGYFPTTSACLRQERRGTGPVITGEASPSYLFDPRVAERVASDLPDARLIVMLRDPVARSRSHYLHEVRLGFEKLSFEDALAAEAGRLAGEFERVSEDPGYTSFNLLHHSYMARGHYCTQIERWFRHFPREQFLFILSERFFDDPAPQLVRAQQFLGLPPEYLTSYPRRNASSPPPPMDEVNHRLANEFASSNARLTELLGIKIAWTAPVEGTRPRARTV